MHLPPLVGVIHSDIKIDCQQNVKWNLTKPKTETLHKFLPVWKVTCILQNMNNIIVLALFLSLTEC